MNGDQLRIGAIVEGDGEVEALPILLRRVVAEISPERWVDVPKPWRLDRGCLMTVGGVEGSVNRLVCDVGTITGLLVLLDADDDCPADLGPRLLARAQAARPDVPVAVVLANREFEAWFLAAASSLRGCAGLAADLENPPDPEQPRGCKEWLSHRTINGRPYKPRSHQSSLAAQFDLRMARENAPSFDKFWRDVEYLITGKR
ncbi:DUF4276 family protein [Nonomuraea cavernae]|uniref:DUF4276 family protein n=1 Tax=Nonomuraea cavernae TaxID=2045107 RepID=UPI0033F9CFA1